MVSINQKLGLKPAGRRAMMKLPANKTEAAKLTAAVCPACRQRGAQLSALHVGELFCTWCGGHWPIAEDDDGPSQTDV